MNESASRLARKRAKNRDALVAAARRLFARDGFPSTTIAAISEAADLGFGTFYRYFADKQAILEAILEIGRDEIDAALLDETLDGSSAAEALIALTGRFAATIGRNRDVLSLMWQEGVRREMTRPLPARHAPAGNQSLPVMLSGAIQRIVDRSIAAGEFAAEDAQATSRIFASAHMILLSPNALSADATTVVRSLCDIELKALSIPEGPRDRGAESGIGRVGR